MNHIKVFIHHSTIPPFLFLSSLMFFFLLFILPSIYPPIHLSFHGPSFRPSIFLSITLSPSLSSTSPSSFHHPNISLYVHPRLSIHPSCLILTSSHPISILLSFHSAVSPSSILIPSVYPFIHLSFALLPSIHLTNYPFLLSSICSPSFLSINTFIDYIFMNNK